MKLRSRIALLVGILVPVYGGCGGERYEPEPVTAAELHERVQQRDARVVIVNYWATWCAPCREEFPEYVNFAADYRDRGVALLFVSFDSKADREKVSNYLEDQGVHWTTFLKEGTTGEFVEGTVGGWSGALPATFIYDEDGTLEIFWEGRGTYARLKRTVEPLLENG